MSRRAVYVGLVLVCAVVYSGGLFASYHADDWSHQHIPRAFSSVSDLFDPPFPFNTSFRPVFLGHLWVLSKISMFSIPLARLWVVLLHAGCSIAVYEIARASFRDGVSRGAPLAGIWFAVSFCHFEVPNALTNSETPGVLLLLLTALWAIERWPFPTTADRFCFLLLWAFALLAKEYALWAPVCLILFWAFARKERRMSKGVLVSILIGMVLVLFPFLWKNLSLDRQAEDMALLLEPSISVAGVSNLLSGIASLPFFDPFQPRWVGIFHERLGLPLAALGVGHAFFLLAVLWLGFRVWCRGNRMVFGLACAFILCPLAMSCWLPGPPASRHVYLPSAGFALLIASEVGRGREWAGRLLVAALVLQGIGSLAVGVELTRTTRERDRVTLSLSENIEGVPDSVTVVLTGLDPKVRVGMSLPFLFPDRTFFSLEASPLLKQDPVERLRDRGFADGEAVVLQWVEGQRFVSKKLSTFLEEESR